MAGIAGAVTEWCAGVENGNPVAGGGAGVDKAMGSATVGADGETSASAESGANASRNRNGDTTTRKMSLNMLRLAGDVEVVGRGWARG